MIDFLLRLVKSAAASVAAFLAGFFYKDYQDVKKGKKHAEKQAKKWANARNTSTPDRLRRNAKRKRGRS